jgi:hypothetical protein
VEMKCQHGSTSLHGDTQTRHTLTNTLIARVRSLAASPRASRSRSKSYSRVSWAASGARIVTASR